MSARIAPRRARPAESEDAGSSAAALRQPFMDAFEIIGGAEALALWAANNPAPFYKLLLGLHDGPEAPAAPAVVAVVSDRPLTDAEWASYSAR